MTWMFRTATKKKKGGVKIVPCLRYYGIASLGHHTHIISSATHTFIYWHDTTNYQTKCTHFTKIETRQL